MLLILGTELMGTHIELDSSREDSSILSSSSLLDFIFLSALPQTTTATAVACQTTAVENQNLAFTATA